MPGICLQIVDGDVLHDSSVAYPDCGSSLPVQVGVPDASAAGGGIDALLTVLFEADPATFVAVFAACFSLPVLTYLVAWAYQSVIGFAGRD